MKTDPDPDRSSQRYGYDRKIPKEPAWIVTEIDGKIASVSVDYRLFAQIASKVADLPMKTIGKISTRKIATDDLISLAENVTWDDLRLFGTDFQLNVWKNLYGLDHENDKKGLADARLYSYSEFSDICGNPLGVRSVAHAVGLNPVAFIIPCHLIVPKEAIDKIEEIRSKAQDTLFKGKDLYLLNSIDVGEYAYGSFLKRRFIAAQFANSQISGTTTH